MEPMAVTEKEGRLRGVFLLEKRHRLKDNREFQRVFKKRQSVANRQFVIYKARSMQEPFRVGISINKKIGNAVTRNRIKRWIKESVRKKKDRICPYTDFIIIARMPVSNMEHEDMESSLYHAMKRAGLFCLNGRESRKAVKSRDR